MEKRVTSQLGSRKNSSLTLSYLNMNMVNKKWIQ